MLKKAAVLLLIFVGTATWVGCGSTTSHYVFAAIPAANQIAVYREDPNSGVLTTLANSPYSTGASPQTLALYPSKKFLYATNSADGKISLFTVGSDRGLTEVTPRTVAGTTPVFSAMDPGGKFLFVGNLGSNNISVFSIDASSGALSEIPNSPFPIGVAPISMALSASGNALYVGIGGTTNGALVGFAVNSSGTGNFLTPLPGSPYPTGRNPYGLTIDPTGAYLYTANNIDNSISEFTIGSDGSLAEVTGSPIGETYKAPIAVAVDPSGKYVYVANSASSNLAAFTIGADGGLTALSNNPAFSNAAKPAVIAADPGGKYLLVGNQSGGMQVFGLNPSNGVLTAVQSYSPGIPSSIVVIQ